jgi:drug/metabolite transporter (DMT)-like permease
MNVTSGRREENKLEPRKSLDASAIVIMVVVCIIWGLQQIGLKYAAPDAAPVLQIGIRSAVSAILVWLLSIQRRQPIAYTGRTAMVGYLAGLFFAVEFLLVGEALRHTSASHVVVFLYTAPIFAALGLHIRLPAERLSIWQWLGIGIAALGTAYAFLAPEAASTSGGSASEMLIGDLLALAGGAVWGSTTVLIRSTSLSGLPANHTLFYQLAITGILLVFYAIVSGQGGITLSMSLTVNLVIQSVVVSFLSYLTWFWLLTRYKASELGVFSFMTPLYGVVFGVVLLGDTITHEFMVGAVAVMAGIVIVSAYPSVRQRLCRQTAV